MAYAVHTINTYITGIQLHPCCDIGGGIRFAHYSCIVINDKAKIGSNCLIFQGVTIGSSRGIHHCGVPQIGNNVFISPGAKIIGNIQIGDYCFIAANSVVTHDVPNYSVIVGAPARIISNNGKDIVLRYQTELIIGNTNSVDH